MDYIDLGVLYNDTEFTDPFGISKSRTNPLNDRYQTRRARPRISDSPTRRFERRRLVALRNGDKPITDKETRYNRNFESYQLFG